MLEVELKAVITDLAETRKRVEKAGARLTYEGRLVDRRYDIESRELADRDEVLRVRRYESGGSAKTYLDWKGRTETQGPYKIREEISTLVDDFAATEQILDKVGFIVTMEIDRDIAQYELGAATIRFETYPRMDVLVEVEGTPDAIEQAIEALGMARGEFTSERLPTFVSRFEKRTGVRAAICDRELTGDSQYRRSDV
ncbi:MAG TPA: class IV adenylate cyclase [Gemmatimonadaceae bacterium]|jgi:predicted adenylyl cyclase CyaB|nr:class IV adenylate cyclase [Gemmatimonadaceae bacterium]